MESYVHTNCQKKSFLVFHDIVLSSLYFIQKGSIPQAKGVFLDHTNTHENFFLKKAKFW